MMEHSEQAIEETKARPKTRKDLRPTSVFWAVLVHVVVVLLLSVGAWAGYWADLRNDQYQLIHLGQWVHDGGRMYVDCWENKPPGIAWLNAAGMALTGGSPLGSWLLPAIVAAMAIATTGAAMKQVLGPFAAAGSMILTAGVCTMRLYDGSCINPDFYSAMFDLAACSLWVVSVHSVRPSRIHGLGYLAGLMWAAALVTKQTGMIGPVVVSLITLFLTALKLAGHKRWLMTCVAGWVGIGTGLFCALFVLYSRGSLSAAWEASYTFNRGLLSLDSLKGLLHSWPRIHVGLAAMQLPLWLSLLGLVATWRVGMNHKPSPASVTVLSLWWSLQVIGALLGPSGSMRYWLATIPPMIWLCGVGIHHLRKIHTGLTETQRTSFVLVCGTVLLLLGGPLFEQYRAGLASSIVSYSSEPSPRHTLEMLGKEIQAVTPEGEQIYVWEYDAGLYVHSDRRAASRFTYPRSKGQLKQILDDLAEGKAHTLLIPKTTSTRFDPWCDDECKAAMTDILVSYEKSEPIGRYATWVQRK